MLGFGRKKTLKVRTYGDPALRRKALPVKIIDNEIIDFAEQLVFAMMKYDGVGLAATQVAVDLRMIALGVSTPKVREDKAGFVLSPGEMQLLPMMPMVMINPEIISYSPLAEVAEEGCLSLPDIYADVKRPGSVLVRAQSIDGRIIAVECGGLLGRALQHEIDHLNGILFVDRVSDSEMTKIKNKLEKLEKSTIKKGFSE